MVYSTTYGKDIAKSAVVEWVRIIVFAKECGMCVHTSPHLPMHIGWCEYIHGIVYHNTVIVSRNTEFVEDA